MEHTPNDLAYCIALLWSEIPLTLEKKVIDRLRREGVYDVWEWALDYPLDAGPKGDCPGGLTWDSCHADDCGVREDGTGCALGAALAAHAADQRASGAGQIPTVPPSPGRPTDTTLSDGPTMVRHGTLGGL